MKIPAETLVQKFIRSYTDTFSAKDFLCFVSKIGVKSSLSECRNYLETDPNVFSLSNDLYATRACVFTNQYFSFKPERKELEQNVFIVGHRCLPFIDPIILSSGITFVYKKHVLEKKVVTFDSAFVLDHFSLYGDEYAPQYIAQDPANNKLNLADVDYILPSKINITAFSTERLKKDGFKYGDRIICRVVDWDNCIVELDFISRNQDEQLKITTDDIERENWYSILEKSLLESFKVLGPLSSIEEQLSVVFADNRSSLCEKNCGSVEELFQRTTKIGFQLFGVETRLWFKGEDVPAVGKWNDINFEDSKELKKKSLPTDELFEEIPPFIVDAAIRDQLYNQIFDAEVLMNNLYPNAYLVSNVLRKAMLLHLKNRHDIILADYNRFADSEISDLRHNFLDLFYKVNKLVYSIDLTGAELSEFPQQPLVILSQIYAHLAHILETSETDPASIVQSKDDLYLSYEGMELNFECVEEDLHDVLIKEAKNSFVVVK